MPGYAQMWDEAVVNPAMLNRARTRMSFGLTSRNDYAEVQRSTNVPLLFLIPVHERESSCSFKRHFHNGDPLTDKTYHVPAGRPLTGSPPYKWSESAIDAVTMKNLHKIGHWSIERVLYEQHRYNGITRYPSSYLLNGTQYYQAGMWVRDHVYDPNVVDPRPGTLVMMKALIELDPSLRLFPREPKPPKEVVNEHTKDATKRGRVVRNAAGGAGGIGAGTEVATKPSAAVQGIPIMHIGVGICMAVFTLAAVWVILKGRNATKEINTLWSGK